MRSSEGSMRLWGYFWPHWGMDGVYWTDISLTRQVLLASTHHSSCSPVEIDSNHSHSLRRMTLPHLPRSALQVPHSVNSGSSASPPLLCLGKVDFLWLLLQHVHSTYTYTYTFLSPNTYTYLTMAVKLGLWVSSNNHDIPGMSWQSRA